ncbi:MAG: hypothetical protein KDD43_09255, partial [Bdellovibrionales bacterium]|nr:hypothetical protein [Bdellovibrionales bacterium]
MKTLLALCMMAVSSIAFAADLNWKKDVTLTLEIPERPERSWGQVMIEVTAVETMYCVEQDVIYERVVEVLPGVYKVDKSNDLAYRGPFYYYPTPRPDRPNAAMRLCPPENQNRKFERKVRFMAPF